MRRLPNPLVLAGSVTPLSSWQAGLAVERRQPDGGADLDHAQHQHLRPGGVVRIDELRNERAEEQQRLGVAPECQEPHQQLLKWGALLLLLVEPDAAARGEVA